MRKYFAALTFFTRLPLWRLWQVDAAYYRRVVDCWSAIGWLTGGVAALTLWAAGMILPLSEAVILALAARMLLTGALHEDGLADFFDGFGGGTSRERILEIMKDSHIGSYGVIAMMLYFITAWAALSSLPPATACAVVFAADPMAKFAASQTVNLLPYARTEATAKNRTVYERMTPWAWAASALLGILPMMLFLPAGFLWCGAVAVTVALLLIFYVKRRLGGYTGDCCGALFLLSELAFYLTAAAIWRLS